MGCASDNQLISDSSINMDNMNEVRSDTSDTPTEDVETTAEMTITYEDASEEIDLSTTDAIENKASIIENPFDDLNESLQNGETVYFESFSIVPQIYTAEIEQRVPGSQGDHVGSVSIEYPMFVSSKVDMTTINEHIYNGMNMEYYRLLNLYEERDFPGAFSIWQFYRIEYKSDEMISILFSGGGSNPGGRTRGHSNSVIINLQTAELLTYSDFMSLEEIEEAIETENFRQLGDNVVRDAMEMVLGTLKLGYPHYFRLNHLNELCIDIDLRFRIYRLPVMVCVPRD